MRLSMPNRIHSALLAFAFLLPGVVRAEGGSCPSYQGYAVAFGSAEKKAPSGDMKTVVIDLAAQAKKDCSGDLDAALEEEHKKSDWVKTRCDIGNLAGFCGKLVVTPPNSRGDVACGNEAPICAASFGGIYCSIDPETGAVMDHDANDTLCKVPEELPEITRITCTVYGKVALPSISCPSAQRPSLQEL